MPVPPDPTRGATQPRPRRRHRWMPAPCTMGIRKDRAAAAATRMVSPSSGESAPRRSDDTERATMAGRPPNSSTPARTVPVTSRRKIGAGGACRLTGPCYGSGHGRAGDAGSRHVGWVGVGGIPRSGRVVGEVMVGGGVLPRSPTAVVPARQARSRARARTRAAPERRASPVPPRPWSSRRSARSNCRSTSAHTSGSLPNSSSEVGGAGQHHAPDRQQDQQHGQFRHETGDLLIVERPQADGRWDRAKIG